MEKEKTIERLINKIRDKAKCFEACFKYLQEEENDTNDESIIDSFHVILLSYLKSIHSLLKEVREVIIWSLVNDKKEEFYSLGIAYSNVISCYKEYVDKEYSKMLYEIDALIKEGSKGFRQSMITETYHEELFKKNLDEYSKDNRGRLEQVYQVDRNDMGLKYPDENELKIHILDEARQELYRGKLGNIYHDNAKNIKTLVIEIISSQNNAYSESEINSFLDKFLAVQIAKQEIEKKEVSVFTNIVFKDKYDVDKIIHKLSEFFDKKIISAQKHWYIAHRVFLKHKMLAKKTQKSFIDQINISLGNKGKCSADDFKKIDSYFKNKDIYEWSLSDINAPQICDEYKRIADALINEFTENRYAMPVKRINPTKK